ncbi:unnamed protein product [Dicrocoelium dendriticum]|nr:unnamed protein product [Dicrocoelium dendriticum]
MDSRAYSTSASQTPLSLPTVSPCTSIQCEESESCTSPHIHPCTSITSQLEPTLPYRDLSGLRVVSTLTADIPTPSAVLPHVFLGSQLDAMSHTICHEYRITHIINVSVDGPAPKHIRPENFHRIPVNDNYTDCMRSFFDEAFVFIDKVKVAKGRVLIHCSAGISRSPTLAIAYLMSSFRMPMRTAYNLIKTVRSTVAPNFNFLGQLLDFEVELSRLGSLPTSLLLPLANSNRSGRLSTFSWVSSESNVLLSDNSFAVSDLSINPLKRHITNHPQMMVSLPRLHSFSKKREWSRHSNSDVPANVHTAACHQHPQGAITSVSPREGKRSRMSLLQHHETTENQLLSPCSFLSRLMLTSPSEERSLTGFPSRALGSASEINFSSEIVSTVVSCSLTNLDNLHFQPCSTHFLQLGCAESVSPLSVRLRRPLTSSLGTRSLRPMLLAKRSLSSQLSTSIPATFVQEKLSTHVHETQLSRSVHGANSTIVSVPLMRHNSRCRISRSAEVIDVLSPCSSVDSFLPRSLSAHIRPHTSDMSTFERNFYASIQKLPSHSFTNIRSCASVQSELTCYPSASGLFPPVCSPKSPFLKTWFPLFDNSPCRQQQKQAFLPSSSSGSSEVSSPSSGRNVVHSSSCFNLYSVS